ncbi:ExeM/NucH family extracellular endonuclease [Alkalimonas mucilaginosa]|uniref:ExeM/NucH family extracellular endonuclease n=1 Tax=Alkalimonas mucilaginosa TaxID=3057676 RepID=A0ABU7JCL6_9GAMM|nr:ExeM/NucH family extracellular endonuclease [Alkalimonas sp. MEB004]MEE2023434.1 ExeM/NucH family extracellular endonuclease [Alkalimonas sp. MEB004]
MHKIGYFFCILAAGFTLNGCQQQQPLSCDSSVTPITAIQGTAEHSPKLGQTLLTQGVLTAYIYPGSARAGWLLQQPGEPALQPSSQAIFLPDDGHLAELKPGQLLAVQGRVAEVEQLTSLIDVQFQSCGQSQTTPLAVTLPLPEHLSWESLEGMWLSFEQPLVVNSTFGLGRHGELTLADKRLWSPTQIHLPGDAAQAHAVLQDRRTLVLDDGSLQQNPEPLPYPPTGLHAAQSLRLGDTLTQVEGVLFQDQRGYRLVPTRQPDWQPQNLRPEPPAARQANELRVASFNVLNFFTGADQDPSFPTRRGASSQAEFERQTAKLTAAILAMDADIIGLIELENNGYGAGSAIATLVSALNAVTERPYAMVETAQQPGNDVIKVGLIYRPDAVQQAGTAATQPQAPFHQLHRAPVAQSFMDLSSRQVLTVSVNHFKSKGGCPRQEHPQFDLMRDQGDGQACWNAARLEAASALHNWLQQQPTGVETPYQLLMGDLNAYRMEDPVRLLEQQGWQYLDAKADQPSYSFVFRGKSGSLDHALASQAFASLEPTVTHWAINADEPVLFEYSLQYKSQAQQQSLYAPDPYRSSDHDPIIITVRFNK